MPELPEVETTKTSLTPLLNQQVTNVSVYQPKLRWPMPSDLAKLEGYTLESVKRRAKYLILKFVPYLNDDRQNATNRSYQQNTPLSSLPKTLIIHLGMSGSLQQLPIGSPKRKHDHLIIELAALNEEAKTSHGVSTHTQLHYHDPRRFGAVVWYDDFGDKLLTHLGAEPLEAYFNAAYLYQKIHHQEAPNQAWLPSTLSKPSPSADTPVPKRKRPVSRPIKSVIMDQQFVVGVGNIYATESLFLSGIHPSMPANELTLEQLTVLVQHIKDILVRAIELGGSTLKDFTVADGTTGYFQQTLNVYGKHQTPCPICNNPIDKVIINGRASTYCSKCQPLNTPMSSSELLK